ncbi:MAG: YbhB/YbcL family Raf kinase inhibitor-like protein [Acidobacteriaceae bacterium]|nr:YbhB/YbcL family Raf kinase inhibitor-like protein [Acidobacteriaceae bacterium]
MPQSMVYNGTLGAACSGQNQSPELSWTRPWFARSFAVVAYDVTANFTHWGIYNIRPDRTSLPANAGVSGSPYGDQVPNDIGYAGYTGPCPPPGLVHHYVFTIYALDTELHLPSSAQFPATPATLFRAMIGHVLQTASITGLYAS